MRTSICRSLCIASLLLGSALVAVGCGPKKSEVPKGFDADAKSGPDAKRSGAVLIPVNTVVTDEVNFQQQDQSDWKMVELKGKPGFLFVELHWDNANSDLNCDIFSSLNEQLAASPGPTPGQLVKKVTAEIPSPGVYYIRIQAPKWADASVYSLSTKWAGEDEAAPEPPPVAPDPVKTPKKPTVKHEGTPKPKKSFDADGGLQGRIVSSYREGGQLVLHIDKGSSSGVKVGTNGAILEGPSGSNPLEGGSFSIVQVIDETKSVGRCGLKSNGRNTRVSLNVKGR